MGQKGSYPLNNNTGSNANYLNTVTGNNASNGFYGFNKNTNSLVYYDYYENQDGLEFGKKKNNVHKGKKANKERS